MLVERLEAIKKRVEEIHAEMAKPEVSQNPEQMQKLGRELSRIEPVLGRYQAYQSAEKHLKETEHLLAAGTNDHDMRKLYEDEKADLSAKLKSLETEIEEMLLGDDGDDDIRNVIIEIRAGTGGEEASLFSRDLFRMYTRFAANHKFNVDVMSTSTAGKGGFKEIVFGISGEKVYSAFKYESGIHRVQRVPETEASGRIHTSAATVAIMQEPDEVEVNIKPEELRIEVCRASGPGGQGVNTTDSAVQIVHLPTGLTVRCQDERSQLKNKAKGMRILRARLLKMKQEEQEKKISEARKSQVGSGDRSGKIRTYNFPDNRVTDHRIGLTLHALDDILNGHLDDLIDVLRKDERTRKLQEQAEAK
ncbi:MAG: peptide chain release factor 1 [Candidatus Omnitrophica bacterium CG11_big_fil_rev_8_21_14_0_20_45_26]|uniref:Peptide chain release factor 1 n=1 Tax=Candidatus Abzuiibacterium crystallinum TaxID=1974748 RepID=A0A2H0LM67_9BACT|nr:MAG: peptide chain release factor 1 [Candidatus Omnitrophica bacterium CG11_big_fil_rev_8_21_14_0_20_45_26]PIW63713.1 MAG: peptide chain release factor 1 [Candidatus Omnitrophica bacterium CG12_big_fil_rev_8_21_14_0_65_45_16]